MVFNSSCKNIFLNINKINKTWTQETLRTEKVKNFKLTWNISLQINKKRKKNPLIEEQSYDKIETTVAVWKLFSIQYL